MDMAHRPPDAPHMTHQPTDDHGHPSARQYIIIAGILAVITLIEVAAFYIPGIPTWALIAGLIILSAGKFVLVVGYYMHLKFDSRIITGVFGFALLIGLAIATAFIALFHGGDF